MKKLRFIFILAMLLSIVACSDDSGNNYSGNNGPNKKEGPLTIEDVKGLWTYDIDGDNDQNLGTTLFDFNHEKATIRSTIIDFEDIKLIDATEQITWKVIPDFLSEPNVYGHREVLSLNYGEEEVNLYVKSFSKDCLELYLLESVEDNTIEAPLKLVRQDEENNKAQLIDMSEEEISSLVGEMVSTENEPLDTDSEDNTNWMGRIDGKRLVCDLSIPGTHDSTTDNVNLLVQFGAKTQAFDVGKQWDKGCRAFDFRVRNYEDDVEMCHGPIPNNYSFRKSFTTVLDRVLRDKTEFGTIFINTEGQPMDDWVQKVFGESSVSVLSGILTTGLVVVHANQLDEELTRIRVFNIIREELRKRNAEDKICYYRPDLTLDEARGKLIIINRVPADYNRTQWDFVGQALIKNKLTIIADDPNKCPDIKDGYMENDLYFADPKNFASNDDFDKARLEEFGRLNAIGYNQRKYGKTRFLIDNCATSSYPDKALWKNTSLPNYVDAANKQYGEFAKINKNQRSCGFIRQDFCGKTYFGRVGLNEMIAEGLILAVLPPRTLRVLALKLYLFIKAKNIALQKQVYGDELLQSTINMNFFDVPLEKANISKTYIDDKIGHTETLKLTDFYPHDANKDTEAVSWESDNPSVATISSDGRMTIKAFGNAIITATLKNGYKTKAYVCSAEHPIGYVNLGLSVLWGNRNLGAAVPEYMGAPFAWGEINPRTDYNQKDYRFFELNEYSKYNENDQKLQLDLEDDAAHVKLGGKWRMPTREEVDELVEKSKISSTMRNGVFIIQVQRNGVTLEFPEAPFYNENGITWSEPPGGYCWTSTLATNAATLAGIWEQAYCIKAQNAKIVPDSVNMYFGLLGYLRYYAMSIRPVRER